MHINLAALFPTETEILAKVTGLRVEMIWSPEISNQPVWRCVWKCICVVCSTVMAADYKDVENVFLLFSNPSNRGQHETTREHHS